MYRSRPPSLVTPRIKIQENKESYEIIGQLMILDPNPQSSIRFLLDPDRHGTSEEVSVGFE